MGKGTTRPGATGPRSEGHRETNDSDDLERALEVAELVQSASDAVIGVSPENLITSWDEGSERLFGYSETEALGRDITMIAPADRVDEPHRIVSHALTGECLKRIETVRIAKDGRPVNVLLSAFPIWGRDGRIAGVVGVFRDISAQRDAEEALSVNERLYRTVVESLHEGIVIHDRAGHILAFNESAERIFGLSAVELADAQGDLPHVPLIHEDGSPLHRDELPTMVSIRTGEPQRDVVLGIEGPDVSTRWISVNSHALTRPNESKPYAAMASFTEITELRGTLEELNEARLEDLKRLALVSEYRDDDTNRHTERVGHTAALLAGKLGLDGELIRMIHSAAPLHDVGKIGIPDSILLKPGKLTTEEFEIVKTHTVIGGRILWQSRFPVVKLAMKIALTHHERWDGTGYPAKLRAEEIPIGGRIVAVADAFDAMIHDRPYKAASSIEHAVAEIKRCSGTQFDPRAVDAFLGLDHSRLVEPA